MVNVWECYVSGEIWHMELNNLDDILIFAADVIKK